MCARPRQLPAPCHKVASQMPHFFDIARATRHRRASFPVSWNLDALSAVRKIGFSLLALRHIFVSLVAICHPYFLVRLTDRSPSLVRLTARATSLSSGSPQDVPLSCPSPFPCLHLWVHVACKQPTCNAVVQSTFHSNPSRDPPV